ncbi:cysteine desulfurase [Candidatus Woesearchaeota archaeon]|nr:MAG: cysteine desulfurase [Candidatus Woesearchaeota archaeon]
MNKADFPILQHVVYLDNAATTQKPKKVIDAIAHFYETSNANAHRGVYQLSMKASQLYDDARKTVADFIHADADEIIFTRNATESINLVAAAVFPLLKGKEIVLTVMEHHSNLIPWQQFAKKNGFTLQFIQMKPDFTLDYQDAEKKINDKTALVAFCQVSNALGTINDAEKIIALAKKHHALTLIDAAQSAPHMIVDVKKLDCDFLAFSGHKMLGPMGIGVLYGKKELLEKMQPYQFGGDMIKSVSLEHAEWNDLPMKFEAGTVNVADAVGLAEAIKYLEHIGMDVIEKKEKELLQYALQELKKIKTLKIYHAEKSSGIISFTMEKVHPHDIASLLDDERICIRAGHHCAMPLMHILGVPATARISFYIYNTREDVDMLVKALLHVEAMFHG